MNLFHIKITIKFHLNFEYKIADSLLDWYIQLIKMPSVAWVLFLSLTALGIFNATQGLLLKTPTKPEKWFPSDSMITIVEEMFQTAFLSADSSSRIPIQVSIKLGVCSYFCHPIGYS